jgi:hypothetical protein
MVTGKHAFDVNEINSFYSAPLPYLRSRSAGNRWRASSPRSCQQQQRLFEKVAAEELQAARDRIAAAD